jgi:hypothetical protein
MTQHAEKYQAKTIIGLPIAMFAPATQPLVRFLVLGLSPTDPLTFLSVVALLAAVAIAATIGPALRYAWTPRGNSSTMFAIFSSDSLPSERCIGAGWIETRKLGTPAPVTKSGDTEYGIYRRWQQNVASCLRSVFKNTHRRPAFFANAQTSRFVRKKPHQ